MSRLELRLMGLITGINLTVGLVLGGLLYLLWPDHYFKWYPSIPVFYWLVGLTMAYFLDRAKRNHEDMIVTIYMIVRICKFIVALAFLWLYVVFVGEFVRTFGLTLMLFYFIYLVLETYTFYLYEKRRMKKR